MGTARFVLAVVGTLSGMAWVGPAARGAPVVTSDFQSGASPFTPTYTPSASDLINGLSPSAVGSGSFTLESSAGVSALTDGTIGTIDRDLAVGPRNAIFATAGNTGGTSVTYTLPSASDLTSIVVYGGWQDTGRDQQNYAVEYATALAPTTFLPLTSVNFNPTGVPGTTPVATRATITDNVGLLAGNVAAVRFNFGTVENGYTGYTEIDIFGTPVPEPATLGLFGAGVVGLLVRRRRRA